MKNSLKIFIVGLVFCVVLLAVGLSKYYSQEDEFEFLEEDNKHKGEIIYQQQIYINACEELLDSLDNSPTFADTYGELDCYDSIQVAKEKIDSLYKYNVLH